MLINKTEGAQVCVTWRCRPAWAWRLRLTWRPAHSVQTGSRCQTAGCPETCRLPHACDPEAEQTSQRKHWRVFLHVVSYTNTAAVPLTLACWSTAAHKDLLLVLFSQVSSRANAPHTTALTDMLWPRDARSVNRSFESERIDWIGWIRLNWSDGLTTHWTKNHL